jgi:hypothetical protein
MAVRELHELCNVRPQLSHPSDTRRQQGSTAPWILAQIAHYYQRFRKFEVLLCTVLEVCIPPCVLQHSHEQVRLRPYLFESVSTENIIAFCMRTHFNLRSEHQTVVQQAVFLCSDIHTFVRLLRVSP